MVSNKLQAAIFLVSLLLTTACCGKDIQANATTGSNIKLTGIVWKWQRFDGAANAADFAIGDPSQYTLILLPGGSYQVKADCNRVRGQYTIENMHIKIASGAATLAECTSGSRYAAYLKYLHKADSFLLQDNKLILKLMKDEGDLVFGNGGAVSN